MSVRNSEGTRFKAGEKQVEIARKGGIASGIAKRRKKDLYQITNMMLNATLNDRSKQQVEKLLGEELPDESPLKHEHCACKRKT